MEHTVIVKEIKPVSNSKKLVANADVVIDGVLIHQFKILRGAEENKYWVSVPQTGDNNGKYYDLIDILDMELADKIRKTILSAYHRTVKHQGKVKK